MIAGEPNIQEPTKLTAAGPNEETKDQILERRYQEWVITLSTEAQSWERVLQQELGDFYLPHHQRDKLAGKSNAWDYVEDNPSLPRVLLIGDSVSRAYTLTVREQLKGVANVHRAPANCGPVARGLKSLDVWLGNREWDVIHFNFGIHNRGTRGEEYSAQLEELTKRLKKTGATLVWATTTPIPDVSGKYSSKSIDRLNDAAAALMQKHGVLVNDLHAAMAPRVDELRLPEDVHFTPEGNEFLGIRVAEFIAKLPELNANRRVQQTPPVEPDKNLHSDGSPWGFKAAAHVADASLPRVLLIGDSILSGYRNQVSKSLAGEATVDAWVNPHFQSEKLNRLLREVLDNRHYDVVHFNVGLHGWQEGRIKPGEFEPLTRSYVQVIQSQQPTAELIWASSTPVLLPDKQGVLDPEVNAIIVEHNRMASDVMQAMGVAVNDFHGALIDKLQLSRGDRYHWKPPAYRILADLASDSIRAALQETTTLQ